MKSTNPENPNKNIYLSKCVPEDTKMKPEYVQLDRMTDMNFNDDNDYKLFNTYKSEKCESSSTDGHRWNNGRCISLNKKDPYINCNKIKNEKICDSVKHKDNSQKCKWQKTADINGYCYDIIETSKKYAETESDYKKKYRGFISDLFYDNKVYNYNKETVLKTLPSLIERGKKIDLAINVKGRNF